MSGWGLYESPAVAAIVDCQPLPRLEHQKVVIPLSVNQAADEVRIAAQLSKLPTAIGCLSHCLLAAAVLRCDAHGDVRGTFVVLLPAAHHLHEVGGIVLTVEPHILLIGLLHSRVIGRAQGRESAGVFELAAFHILLRVVVGARMLGELGIVPSARAKVEGDAVVSTHQGDGLAASHQTES